MLTFMSFKARIVVTLGDVSTGLPLLTAADGDDGGDQREQLAAA